VGQQVLVRPDRLQIAEEIQGVLAIDLERVVLTERESLRVQPELQIGGSAAQGQVQGPQGRRQAFEVVGGASIAKVDVVGDARAAHERFSLPADDDELHTVLGEHFAEAFKRALLEPLVQSPAPSARPAVHALPGAPAPSA